MRPTVRAASRVPVAVSLAACLAVAAIPRWAGGGAAAGLYALRAAALVLASGLAYAVEDPAAATLSPSPTPLASRRGLRVAYTVALFAVAWSASLVLAPAGVPRAVATLEAFALLAGALSIASVSSAGALAAGPALAVGLMAARLVQLVWPGAFALLSEPNEPSWHTAQACWGVLLAAGLVVLAASANDPAVSWWRRPRRP